MTRAATLPSIASGMPRYVGVIWFLAINPFHYNEEKEKIPRAKVYNEQDQWNNWWARMMCSTIVALDDIEDVMHRLLSDGQPGN